MPRVLKSLLAIFLGSFTIVVLVMVWAFVIAAGVWPELKTYWENKQPVPPEHIAFKIEIGVNFVAALVGGYVCALVARRREILHAVLLAVFLFGAGTLTALAMAASATEAQKAEMEKSMSKPAWEQLTTPAMLLAGVLTGAFLRGRQAHADKR